jgi:hypothetical protein
MRKVKFVSMFLLLTLLLSASTAGAVEQEPPPEQVPVRIPSDQVPWDKVKFAGVKESVGIPPSESEAVAGKPIPQRVPDDQVPEVVNRVEFKEVIAVPIAKEGIGRLFGRSGTVTLTYGFYWYQWNPWNVAVAGYARTQSDFCATRLYAEAKLYRDVEHDGTWEFMERDISNATGSCVTDSGEAKTGYWTAPNDTNWKVMTDHLAEWVGEKDSWTRVKYDSFP